MRLRVAFCPFTFFSWVLSELYSVQFRQIRCFDELASKMKGSLPASPPPPPPPPSPPLQLPPPMFATPPPLSVSSSGTRCLAFHGRKTRILHHVHHLLHHHHVQHHRHPHGHHHLRDLHCCLPRRKACQESFEESSKCNRRINQPGSSVSTTTPSSSSSSIATHTLLDCRWDQFLVSIHLALTLSIFHRK